MSLFAQLSEGGTGVFGLVIQGGSFVLLAYLIVYGLPQLHRTIASERKDERGEHARAEFIRVQCELAALSVDEHSIRYWDGQLGNGPDYYQKAKSLHRRERELLDSLALEWNWWSRDMPLDLSIALDPRKQPRPVGFTRGFVSHVTLDTAAFLRHAGALFAAAPIEGVTLSDKRPRPYGGEYCWSCAFEDEGESHTENGWWLPSSLFRRLPYGGSTSAYFESEALALSALSAACVRHGRATRETK